MRQPRRLAGELCDDDRWDCVWVCGKSYRATSSRSIQRHANSCYLRSDGQTGDVDVKMWKERSKEQRRKRRSYELFDSVADHSSEDGGGGEEDSATSGHSSAHSSHSALFKQAQLTIGTATSGGYFVQNDMGVRAMSDGSSWDTAAMDGPLDDILPLSLSLSPTAQYHSRLQQHRATHLQQQRSQLQPTGQLASMGSLGRLSHTSSVSSAWPPQPLSSTASSAASSSFSSSSASLLSPPSISLDVQTCQPIRDMQPVSPHQSAATSSVTRDMWSVSPPLTPPIQLPQPFTALPRHGFFPPAAANAIDRDSDGGGSSASQAPFMPSSAPCPDVSSCAAPSVASSSSWSSLPVAPSAPCDAPYRTLYERERVVSDELCSLLKSLYTRYGMTHPVFQQRIVSSPLLQRALALANNNSGTNNSNLS